MSRTRHLVGPLALVLSACNATMPTNGSAAAGSTAPGLFDRILAQSPTAAGPATGASLAAPGTGTGTSSGGRSGNTIALAKDTSTPERQGIAAAGAQTAPKAVADPDEIKRMLVRADPSACSATQDATAAEVLDTWSRLATSGLSSLLDAKFKNDDRALQSRLDELKPVMRQLARNTTWLPQSAERAIGERLLAFNKLDTYERPKRPSQRKLLEEVVRPIFEDLKRYAKEELHNEMEFEMLLYRDESSPAPRMISGGYLLVPSKLFDALESVKKPEVLVAFLFAHEFSHALRRHNTKKVQMAVVDSMMLASEFRQLYNTDKNMWDRMRGGIAANFEFKAKSVVSLIDQTCKAKSWLPLMEQGQEFEADVCGAMLLDRAGKTRGKVFSPVEGFAQYLEAGLATSVKKASAANILEARFQRCMIDSDHPSPDDRKANLQTYTVALQGGRGAVNLELTTVSTTEPKGRGVGKGRGKDHQDAKRP